MKAIKKMSRDEMLDILISQISEQAEKELEKIEWWLKNVDNEEFLCELWEEKLKVKYLQKVFLNKKIYNARYGNNCFILDDHQLYLMINRALSHIHQLMDATTMFCLYENPHDLAWNFISIFEGIVIEKTLEEESK